MATKKQTSKTTSPNDEKVVWKGSFNHWLTDADKVAIRDYNMLPDAVFGYMREIIGLGYKISFNEEKNGRFFIATAYASDPTNVNAGWSMSMFHSDVLIAMISLHHVIVTVYDKGEWPADKQLDFQYTW
jgi:hypothetical protein